ncbi:MAG TPA: hypothetical protein DD614_01665 [Clostridiales bacterium]|nr:hypothetical protein [Clostridiales bacterium]
MSKISKLVIILTSAILTLLIICSCVVFRYKIIYDFSNIKIKSDSLSGISVMTYNIKCNDRLDFSKSGWYYRAKYVAQNIQENLATIICFQEVKIEQYDFLKNCLEEYESVILFRDKTSLTEGTPIFYKSDCFDLVSFDSFWLSDTPTEMSNTWNGAYPRVCTSVVLKEKITNKEFAVFNTHLDHLSQLARINGLSLIKSKIESCKVPAIITGDMNSIPTSQVITTFKSDFDDLNDIWGWGENEGTFKGGGENANARIDYIFKSKNQFELVGYKIINKTFDGVNASDHFPIYAELKI